MDFLKKNMQPLETENVKEVNDSKITKAVDKIYHIDCSHC